MLETASAREVEAKNKTNGAGEDRLAVREEELEGGRSSDLNVQKQGKSIPMGTSCAALGVQNDVVAPECETAMGRGIGSRSDGSARHGRAKVSTGTFDDTRPTEAVSQAQGSSAIFISNPIPVSPKARHNHVYYPDSLEISESESGQHSESDLGCAASDEGNDSDDRPLCDGSEWLPIGKNNDPDYGKDGKEAKRVRSAGRKVRANSETKVTAAQASMEAIFLGKESLQTILISQFGAQDCDAGNGVDFNASSRLRLESGFITLLTRIGLDPFADKSADALENETNQVMGHALRFLMKHNMKK